MIFHLFSSAVCTCKIMLSANKDMHPVIPGRRCTCMSSCKSHIFLCKLCEAYVCTHTSMCKCLYTHTHRCEFSSQDNRSTVNCFAFCLLPIEWHMTRNDLWLDIKVHERSARASHYMPRTHLNICLGGSQRLNWSDCNVTKPLLNGKLRLGPEEQEQAVVVHSGGNMFLCLARLSLFYSPIKFSATSDL